MLEKNGDGTYTIPLSEECPITLKEWQTPHRITPMDDGTEVRTVSIDAPITNQERYEMCGLRPSFYKLSKELYLKAGKCQEILYWDKNTQFCGVCGAPMKLHTDISKRCTNCGKEVWPQLATAIIVLIHRGDDVLLVHARNFKGDFYGLVAGFVETGETLEEAVRREVMEETGESGRKVLDDEGKNLILRKIAGKLEPSLKVIKANLKKPGYTSEVKSVISELTQYNIQPEGMGPLFDAAGDNMSLLLKLKDIQTVYSAFEQYLADQYITKEEILDVLSRVMGKSRILKDSVIALDGFTGFTPVQNKVLSEMLTYCSKVCVTVTMDERENPYVLKDKYQLFSLSKQMVKSLIELAQEKEVLVEESVCLYSRPVYRFRCNPALAHLESEVFRHAQEKYQKKTDRVRLYLAHNPADEVMCAAQRMLQ